MKFGWRIALVLIIIVAAYFSFYPPKEKINLGLDLQGGMYVVLEVDALKLFESKASDIDSQFRELLSRLTDKKGLSADEVFKAIEDQAKDLKVDLPKYFPDISAPDNKAVIKELKGRAQGAMDNVEEIIRTRIDEFGVAEPQIQLQGKERLIVQLPGIENAKRAKEIIERQALLEFKIVREEGLEEALKGNIPAGCQLVYFEKEEGQEKEAPLLVESSAKLTGEYLESAGVSWDQFGRPVVSLTFNDAGSKRFFDVTKESVGKRLAILLDGHPKSAPNVNEPISGGRAQISGRFSEEEAGDLAVVLRAGSLPVPIQLAEDRTVGPTLGQDSINKGLVAAGIGMMLVILFMIIRYKFSGLVADLALIFNMIIIFGALAGFSATLTLPGIAGIILTIGMSVDANVIIFERIKEELRKGKTVRTAIADGFGRAFWTIFDAQTTTLIAAFVLFQFGTGPIKGFAVTLSIGIFASMFTALFFSRLVFDLVTTRRDVRRLSI